MLRTDIVANDNITDVDPGFRKKEGPTTHTAKPHSPSFVKYVDHSRFIIQISYEIQVHLQELN